MTDTRGQRDSSNDCEVRIIGLVSRMVDGQRVAVPHGIYAGRKTDEGLHLSRPGGPEFDLSILEASRYLNSKDMKIVSGHWP